jgi:hypothetical protein
MCRNLVAEWPIRRTLITYADMTMRHFRWFRIASLAAGLCTAAAAEAQMSPDTTARLRWSGLVDAYIAYDAGRPRTLDRSFTTTAARHAEFNVNLAHLAATYESPNVRGRLALQAGTSVQANYAPEPRVGAVSGPDLARLLQEAYAGVRLRDGLWMDAGIYFAPFGRESWISADNWTYTRSLIADNSPYYQSGVRLSWQATPALTAQVHLLNGWQNISETNDDKAVAASLDWTFATGHVLSWDAFAGNEQPDSQPRRMRVFNEVSWQGTLTKRLEAMATLDVGQQARSAANGETATWWGTAVIARHALAPGRAWLAVRGEAYRDPQRVIITPPGGAAFVGRGASVNLDLALQPGVLWRTEARTLRTRDVVFADRDAGSGASRRNLVVVTSLAWRF